MKAAPRPPHTHLPGPSPLSRSSHVLIRPSPPCEKHRRICQERSALREAGPIKFYQLISPRLPLTSFLGPVPRVLPPAERGPAFVISCSASALSSQTGGGIFVLFSFCLYLLVTVKHVCCRFSHFGLQLFFYLEIDIFSPQFFTMKVSYELKLLVGKNIPRIRRIRQCDPLYRGCVSGWTSECSIPFYVR